MQAYLTIDDSPTPYTNELIKALYKRSIPALLFIRGDMIEKYGDDPLRKAVSLGFVLGNHMVSHTRTSMMSFGDVTDEIKIMQDKIAEIYHSEGIQSPAQFFRFPHMDRGTGGSIVDYDKIAEPFRPHVINMFAEGLNIELIEPTRDQVEHKENIQSFLKSCGYAQPFQSINFPWFKGEMQEALDCMYTYSTADWMLLDRHRNSSKWPYKTLDDLKEKIDADRNLRDSSTSHIVLAHDKDEEGFNKNIVIPLIDYMTQKGFTFLPFDKKENIDVT